MQLIDHTLAQFTEVLASNAPAPGGGSASALAGAVGAALTGMVAALTVGKQKYADREEDMTAALEQAEAIRLEFLQVIDRDTQAFNQVSAVFSMPKDTDEEKAARRAAMQAGLKASTLPPYRMMELGLSGLRLAEGVLEGFNASAASDLGVSALQLCAAVRGGWLNVLINIGGIQDQAFAARYRTRGEAILREAETVADKVYQAVLALV